MPDYQNGKIYKLVGGGLTYYGSTTNELHKRLFQHRVPKAIETKKFTSYKLFETGDKVEIILVEKYPCNDKNELTRRERYYIENFECVNKAVPQRNDKEYYKDNREKIKKQSKKYYEEHKEEALIKQKERYEKNKEKQYKQNRERILEKRKDPEEYEKIKKYQREYMRKRRDYQN